MRFGLPAALLLVLAFAADAGQAADFNLHGALTQGGLVTGQAPAGALVTLDGQPVQVTADGRFVIGFGREAAATARLGAIMPDGVVVTQVLEIAPRSFAVQRIDGLPPAAVTMPPNVEAQYNREREQVGFARAARSDMTFWSEGFIWPSTGRISGVYGSQRILNGEPRTPHYGVDIAGPVGRRVVAPAGGTVVLARTGFVMEGGIVIIDHGFGVFSTLFHLDKVGVTAGQSVAQGDPIGTIGKTGRATGPHVDWRINWGEVRIDPALVTGPFPPR